LVRSPRPNAVEKAAIHYVAVYAGSTYSVRALRDAIEAKFPGALARAKADEKKAAFDRKFVGHRVPAWAKTYIRKHARGVSAVIVRRSEYNDHTSGHFKTWDNSITVTIGGDETDARLALLHEIAHANKPYAQHGDGFYDEYRRLLVAERLLGKALNNPLKHGGTVRGLRAAGRRARSAKPVTGPADGTPGPQALRDLMKI
jgi:hypothetical protein